MATMPNVYGAGAMGYDRDKYDAYITSSRWRAFRRRYFASKMPHDCVACGSATEVTLHHLTYRRLGSERLTDVAPLCWPCHERLHRAGVTDTGDPLGIFKYQLRVVFGLTRAVIKKRLAKWVDAKFCNRMGRKERRLENQRVKLKREAEANRKLHERMCSR